MAPDIQQTSKTKTEPEQSSGDVVKVQGKLQDVNGNGWGIKVGGNGPVILVVPGNSQRGALPPTELPNYGTPSNPSIPDRIKGERPKNEVEACTKYKEWAKSRQDEPSHLARSEGSFGSVLQAAQKDVKIDYSRESYQKITDDIKTNLTEIDKQIAAQKTFIAISKDGIEQTEKQLKDSAFKVFRGRYNPLRYCSFSQWTGERGTYYRQLDSERLALKQKQERLAELEKLRAGKIGDKTSGSAGSLYKEHLTLMLEADRLDGGNRIAKFGLRERAEAILGKEEALRFFATNQQKQFNPQERDYSKAVDCETLAMQKLAAVANNTAIDKDPETGKAKRLFIAETRENYKVQRRASAELDSASNAAGTWAKGMRVVKWTATTAAAMIGGYAGIAFLAAAAGGSAVTLGGLFSGMGISSIIGLGTSANLSALFFGGTAGALVGGTAMSLVANGTEAVTHWLVNTKNNSQVGRDFRIDTLRDIKESFVTGLTFVLGAVKPIAWLSKTSFGKWVGQSWVGKAARAIPVAWRWGETKIERMFAGASRTAYKIVTEPKSVFTESWLGRKLFSPVGRCFSQFGKYLTTSAPAPVRKVCGFIGGNISYCLIKLGRAKDFVKLFGEKACEGIKNGYRKAMDKIAKCLHPKLGADCDIKIASGAGTAGSRTISTTMLKEADTAVGKVVGGVEKATDKFVNEGMEQLRRIKYGTTAAEKSEATRKLEELISGYMNGVEAMSPGQKLRDYAIDRAGVYSDIVRSGSEIAQTPHGLKVLHEAIRGAEGVTVKMETNLAASLGKAQSLINKAAEYGVANASGSSVAAVAKIAEAGSELSNMARATRRAREAFLALDKSKQTFGQTATMLKQQMDSSENVRVALSRAGAREKSGKITMLSQGGFDYKIGEKTANQMRGEAYSKLVNEQLVHYSDASLQNALAGGAVSAFHGRFIDTAVEERIRDEFSKKYRDKLSSEEYDRALQLELYRNRVSPDQISARFFPRLQYGMKIGGFGTLIHGLSGILTAETALPVMPVLREWVKYDYVGESASAELERKIATSNWQLADKASFNGRAEVPFYTLPEVLLKEYAPADILLNMRMMGLSAARIPYLRYQRMTDAALAGGGLYEQNRRNKPKANDEEDASIEVDGR